MSTRRAFSTISAECVNHMKALGINNPEIVFNPSVAELYEYALRPEHMSSPDPTVGPTTITATGALSCSSGSKMGRVPKEKRIVLDDMTREDVHWGEINIPMQPENFARNR